MADAEREAHARPVARGSRRAFGRHIATKGRASGSNKGELHGQPRFGAGIWHFATYVDRYATDGYGAPRNIIEAIDLAGQVRDLSVVDLNWPFFGGDFLQRADQGRARPQQARRHRHHAGDVHAAVQQGRLHQPRRRRTPRGARPHHRSLRRSPLLRGRLRQALARPGRLGLPVPGRPRRAVEALARRHRAARQREPRPEVRHRVQAA